jgi:hypothetical protein
MQTLSDREAPIPAIRRTRDRATKSDPQETFLAEEDRGSGVVTSEPRTQRPGGLIYNRFLDEPGLGVPDLVSDRPRDTNSTGLGARPQTGRDISHRRRRFHLPRRSRRRDWPQCGTHALLLAHRGLAVDHPALDVYGAAHRIHNTWKFREHAVVGTFDDPPLMLADLGSTSLTKCALKRWWVPSSGVPHQARIARHIGGQDRGETAGRSFFRHPSLAQPGEIGRFKERTDLRPGASDLALGQRELDLSDA